LTVRTPQSAKAVTTSAATLVVNLSGDQPVIGSLADLKLGNAIVAIGTGDASAFNANTLIVLEKDARKLLKPGKPNQPAAPPARVR
jgi:hypothetical protein